MLDLKLPTHRRGFLGSMAGGIAALGLGGFLPRGLSAQARPAASSSGDAQLDAWLNRITGAHKQVYDLPKVNGGAGLVWSRVFYMTNEETGVPESDVTVVLVMRHVAAALALTDAMWSKYSLGELTEMDDPKTKKRSVRNLYYHMAPDEMGLPGMSIDALMASGALVGVCHMAIKSVSRGLAKKMNLSADDIAEDMVANRIPGVQVVPSGVWAVNRAQERGCTYCFAG